MPIAGIVDIVIVSQAHRHEERLTTNEGGWVVAASRGS